MLYRYILSSKWVVRKASITRESERGIANCTPVARWALTIRCMEADDDGNLSVQVPPG